MIARAGLLMTVLALAACAGTAPWDPFGTREPGEAPEAISIYAHNENVEDVVLYVLSAAGIQRVGSVAPERTETFHVRWDGARELRVRVEIFAGPRYTTNSLPTVSPGDRVEVLVPARVERSVIRRR